jgi:hypothetical protein
LHRKVEAFSSGGGRVSDFGWKIKLARLEELINVAACQNFYNKEKK